MNQPIRYSYALHLAYLAGLHVLGLEGPPLDYFNPAEVEAAEKVLFNWYRATKRIRKTELAHDAHNIIGDGHLALLTLHWQLQGWRDRPLRPKQREALEKAVKILPHMAAWCSNEYEKDLC
jgi:hypothetical protein